MRAYSNYFCFRRENPLGRRYYFSEPLLSVVCPFSRTIFNMQRFHQRHFHSAAAAVVVTGGSYPYSTYMTYINDIRLLYNLRYTVVTR